MPTTNRLNIQPENSVPIVRGSSKTLLLTVTDANDRPVDLTGAKVVMTVKRSLEDRDPLIYKTSDDPNHAVIPNPRDGQAKIYLLPSDTQRLEVRQYIFDVWVILNSGKRYPVVPPSVFDVTAGVTIFAT